MVDRGVARPAPFWVSLIGWSAVALLVILVIAESAFPSRSFEGELRLAVGDESNVAWLRTPEGGISGAELIPQLPASAARWISPEANYRVATMPEAIELANVEIVEAGETVHAVSVSNLDGTTRTVLDGAESVQIGADDWAVIGVGQWGGLYEDERGRPMAALALKPSPDIPWIEPLLLDEEIWLQATADSSIYFDWFEDKATAEIAINNELTGIRSARWGIRDGSAVNWFSDFTPGTGAVLNDGTAVTLLQYEEAFSMDDAIVPAIEVELVKGDAREVKWVAANAGEPDSAVVFEDLAQSPYVWIVYAWDNDAGVAALYEEGVQIATTAVTRGQIWRPEDRGEELRVDRLLESAVPVVQQDEAIQGLRLAHGDRQLWIRQGEQAIVGENTVAFNEALAGGTVRYTVWLRNPGSSEPGAKHILAAGDVVNAGNWEVRQAETEFVEPDYAVLSASFYGRTPPMTMALRVLRIIAYSLVVCSLIAGGIRYMRNRRAHG